MTFIKILHIYSFLFFFLLLLFLLLLLLVICQPLNKNSHKAWLLIVAITTQGNITIIIIIVKLSLWGGHLKRHFLMSQYSHTLNPYNLPVLLFSVHLVAFSAVALDFCDIHYSKGLYFSFPLLWPHLFPWYYPKVLSSHPPFLSPFPGFPPCTIQHGPRLFVSKLNHPLSLFLPTSQRRWNN